MRNFLYQDNFNGEICQWRHFLWRWFLFQWWHFARILLRLGQYSIRTFWSRVSVSAAMSLRFPLIRPTKITVNIFIRPFKNTYFSIKIYNISPKNDLFCCLWGKFSCPLNIALIFLKKMYDIIMILVELNVEIFHDFGWYFATRIRLTKIYGI